MIYYHFEFLKFVCDYARKYVYVAVVYSSSKCAHIFCDLHSPNKQIGNQNSTFLLVNVCACACAMSLRVYGSSPFGIEWSSSCTHCCYAK